MREKNRSFRREELEMLSSAELNQMVRYELDKGSIDRETVLQILRILEDRDAEDPTLQKVDDTAAWEEFQMHFVATENSHVKSGNAHTRKKSVPWFAKTAVAAIIVFALLFAAPPALGYENVFELIGRWTQDVFELIVPSSRTAPQDEYVFKTEHPGLQQVYEAVAEIGITQPVVPTWLPEGYKLNELKITPLPTGKKLYSLFVNEGNTISFSISPYSDETAHKYEKNDRMVLEYGIAGTTHYVMQDEEEWIAVWEVSGNEIVLSMNTSEDILYKVLESIYLEDQK